MKIAPRQIESFVKAPDKSMRAILVYGPDHGLVKERAKTIGMSVVADYNDPFNVVVFCSDILAEDPARLADEAFAISMMGGERLIRIEGASDKIASLLKSYLEKPNDSALIVLEADNLTPRSSLRALCEKAENAAALACYVEDERDLGRLIREQLAADGHNIDPDAAQWLASNISGDRARARSEIEKLSIYLGASPAKASLEDVQAACGAAGAQGFDDLAMNVASRKAEAALKAYHHLTEEGVAFVAILRSLQNHFRRLHLVRSYMNDGLDMSAAMGKLSPPLFFKQKDEFAMQIRAWSLPALSKVLERFAALEAQCKTTGAPVDTLCAQAILALSSVGTRRR